MVAGQVFPRPARQHLASDVYNADEFVCRDPRKLGPGALVILCSQTGATKETVRAAQHARERGAVTIGMTLDPARRWPRPLTAPSTTRPPIRRASLSMRRTATTACSTCCLRAVVDQRENAGLTPPLLTSLSHLQPAIERAHARYARHVRTRSHRVSRAERYLHTGQRRRLWRCLFLFHLRSDGDAVVRFTGDPRQRVFPRPLRGRRQGRQLHRDGRS